MSVQARTRVTKVLFSEQNPPKKGKYGSLRGPKTYLIVALRCKPNKGSFYEVTVYHYINGRRKEWKGTLSAVRKILLQEEGYGSKTT